MPVAVVLKFEAVTVKALAPVEIELAPRPERVKAPEVAVKLSAPVVCVRPLDAVKSPAEVTVPVPVVEILFEVEIVLVVAIEPKPEAIEPEDKAPTVVSDEVTTFEASVVPEILPAAFTVIVAFGKVMVLACVGSVIAKVVLLASAVAPSKTKGDAPVTLAPESATLPLAVKVCVTVKAPFAVVVVPALPNKTAVAFTVPRLSAVAESSVSAPAEVDHVEAAPPVKVSAPAEVNDEAPVGVRLTLPAPAAVKFPEVRVKAMSREEEVVIVWPLL
jgi:hypothetical protein